MNLKTIKNVGLVLGVLLISAQIGNAQVKLNDGNNVVKQMFTYNSSVLPSRGRQFHTLTSSTPVLIRPQSSKEFFYVVKVEKVEKDYYLKVTKQGMLMEKLANFKKKLPKKASTSSVVYDETSGKIYIALNNKMMALEGICYILDADLNEVSKMVYDKTTPGVEEYRAASVGKTDWNAYTPEKEVASYSFSRLKDMYFADNNYYEISVDTRDETGTKTEDNRAVIRKFEEVEVPNFKPYYRLKWDFSTDKAFGGKQEKLHSGKIVGIKGDNVLVYTDIETENEEWDQRFFTLHKDKGTLGFNSQLNEGGYRRVATKFYMTDGEPTFFAGNYIDAKDKKKLSFADFEGAYFGLIDDKGNITKSSDNKFPDFYNEYEEIAKSFSKNHFDYCAFKPFAIEKLSDGDYLVVGEYKVTSGNSGVGWETALTMRTDVANYVGRTFGFGYFIVSSTLEVAKQGFDMISELELKKIYQVMGDLIEDYAYDETTGELVISYMTVSSGSKRYYYTLKMGEGVARKPAILQREQKGQKQCDMMVGDTKTLIFFDQGENGKVSKKTLR